MNSTKAHTWEITYSDDYDELNGNILKVTPDFLALLQNHESISVEGREDEDFLFSVENNTYKLRDIFIPSTMLLTRELVEGEGRRDVAYVSLETAHYLKLQGHNIEYNTIYMDLVGEAVSKELLEESSSISQLVMAAGINASAICSRFRVTPAQLQQLLKHAPAMVLRRKDLPSLEEPTVVVWGNDALLSIMRQLLPYLMELGITGEWFTFQQVASLVKHESILQLLARVFQLEIQGNNDGGWSLGEPMEVQQPIPLRFKLKIESMVRFVLLEHLLVKQEYTVKEMDSSLWNLLITYLPIGLPAFEEDKAKKTLQELIGDYFFMIPQQAINIRVAYDPMLANSTIKDRLQFLRSYKKKFSLGELRGVFRRMVKEVELNDVLMKHFRKCGQEYELKLVIPK